MLSQSAAEQLARNKKIGGAEYRVLFFLSSKINYDDSAQISQGDIGQVIGMNQSCVARAIKTLKEVGIIRSEGKLGQTATYTLNPFYYSRAKAHNIVQRQRKWNDNSD